jgi:DNA-binding XRE family transcriptional regulator
MSTKHVDLKKLEHDFGPLTFGRLLLSHRLGEELTQAEMAKKLKISKQSVNDLEKGRKIPSIRRTIQIARKIGILEKLAIQLILQDQLGKEKLNYKIQITGPGHLKKAA